MPVNKTALMEYNIGTTLYSKKNFQEALNAYEKGIGFYLQNYKFDPLDQENNQLLKYLYEQILNCNIHLLLSKKTHEKSDRLQLTLEYFDSYSLWAEKFRFPLLSGPKTMAYKIWSYMLELPVSEVTKLGVRLNQLLSNLVTHPENIAPKQAKQLLILEILMAQKVKDEPTLRLQSLAIQLRAIIQKCLVETAYISTDDETKSLRG